MDNGSFCLISDMKELRDSLTRQNKIKFPLRKMRNKLQGCDQLKVGNCTFSTESGDTSVESSDIPEPNSSCSISSIEEVRDADFQQDICPPLLTNNARVWNQRFNSTLNEDIHSAPIAKFRDPTIGVLSPIEGSIKHNKNSPDYGGFHLDEEKEFNIKLQGRTPPHVLQKLTELSKLAKVDKHDEEMDEEEWIPKSKSFRQVGNQFWLESEDRSTKLKSLPPRTYTPARKQAPQRLSLPKPTLKRVIRSSSPNPTCQPLPKAKRILIETLDLSSIQNASPENDSSLELVPRPETPGTVNSDEIAVSEISGLNNNSEESLAKPVTPLSPSTKPQIPPDPIGLLPSPPATTACTVKATRKLRHLYYPKDILES